MRAPKNLKSIIVDMVIKCKHLHEVETLADSDWLVDGKTYGPGEEYKKIFILQASAVAKRQVRGNREYQSTAAELDTRLHGTAPGTQGPFSKVLAEYGRNSRVLIPVVGFFGEASRDLHDLWD